MRIDLYTKVILTSIAVLLAVITVKLIFQPTAVVQAQSSLSNLQFLGGGDLIVMDKQSGQIWEYNVSSEDGGTKSMNLGKFVGFGKPLVK